MATVYILEYSGNSGRDEPRQAPPVESIWVVAETFPSKANVAIHAFPTRDKAMSVVKDIIRDNFASADVRAHHHRLIDSWPVHGGGFVPINPDYTVTLANTRLE